MLKKAISFLICFCFIFEQAGFAQVAPSLGIPAYLNNLPPLADKFRPLQMRALAFDPREEQLGLYLDKGDEKNLPQPAVGTDSKALMDYFQIGLRLPSDAFWVNLRPDSPQNIIDADLEKTELGRVMLAADLQLKKDISLLTSPDTAEGRQYWNRLYEKIDALYGPEEDVEIPTMARPWIVPGEIIIGEASEEVYIYKATLDVMLEQDYLKNQQQAFSDVRVKELNEYSSQLIRQLLIPKLVKSVNSSKKYAQLRQVYYSLILAQWFKQRHPGMQELNSRDLSGLTSRTAWSKQNYFDAYRKSFAEGEYHKEEQVNSPYGVYVRQYVSGGMVLGFAQGLASNLKDIVVIPIQQIRKLPDRIMVRLSQDKRIEMIRAKYPFLLHAFKAEEAVKLDKAFSEELLGLLNTLIITVSNDGMHVRDIGETLINAGVLNEAMDTARATGMIAGFLEAYKDVVIPQRAGFFRYQFAKGEFINNKRTIAEYLKIVAKQGLVIDPMAAMITEFDRISADVPRYEFVKRKPVLALLIPDKNNPDIPQSIWEHMGEVDQSGAGSLEKIKENPDTAIMIEYDESTGAQYYQNYEFEQYDIYKRVSIDEVKENNPELYKNVYLNLDKRLIDSGRIIGARKTHADEFIRISDLGPEYGVDKAVQFFLKKSQRRQLKPAGQEGYLRMAGDFPQNLVNADAEGKPLGYEPYLRDGGESGTAGIGELQLQKKEFTRQVRNFFEARGFSVFRPLDEIAGFENAWGSQGTIFYLENKAGQKRIAKVEKYQQQKFAQGNRRSAYADHMQKQSDILRASKAIAENPALVKLFQSGVIEDIALSETKNGETYTVHADFFYALMEFIEGREVGMLMRTANFSENRKVILQQLIEFIKNIRLLHEAGFVHGELLVEKSPHNILLGKEGFKIVDLDSLHRPQDLANGEFGSKTIAQEDREIIEIARGIVRVAGEEIDGLRWLGVNTLAELIPLLEELSTRDGGVFETMEIALDSARSWILGNGEPIGTFRYFKGIAEDLTTPKGDKKKIGLRSAVYIYELNTKEDYAALEAADMRKLFEALKSHERDRFVRLQIGEAGNQYQEWPSFNWHSFDAKVDFVKRRDFIVFLNGKMLFWDGSKISSEQVYFDRRSPDFTHLWNLKQNLERRTQTGFATGDQEARSGRRDGGTIEKFISAVGTIQVKIATTEWQELERIDRTLPGADGSLMHKTRGDVAQINDDDLLPRLLESAPRVLKAEVEKYGNNQEPRWSDEEKALVVSSVKLEPESDKPRFDGSMTFRLVLGAGAKPHNSQDGGALNELGGIDFRALPLVTQSAGTLLSPAVDMQMLRNLAKNSDIKDVDREWQLIQKRLEKEAMPYQRIKEYIAVCCSQEEQDKIEQVSEFIDNVLRLEEDNALPTAPELKELLVLVESISIARSETANKGRPDTGLSA